MRSLCSLRIFLFVSSSQDTLDRKRQQDYLAAEEEKERRIEDAKAEAEKERQRVEWENTLKKAELEKETAVRRAQAEVAAQAKKERENEDVTTRQMRVQGELDRKKAVDTIITALREFGP